MPFCPRVLAFSIFRIFSFFPGRSRENITEVVLVRVSSQIFPTVIREENFIKYKKIEKKKKGFGLEF